MANTLEQIQQGLINEATGTQGKLNLDNSIIQSDCYANILTAANVTAIAVQVSATLPANDIFIQGGILFVKGAASMYDGTVSSFQLQLIGEDETSRTAQLTGTLSALDITQLNSLKLITANPILPPISFSNLALNCLSNPPLSLVANMSLTVSTSTSGWPLLPDIGISLTAVGMSFVRDGAGNASLGLSGDMLIPNEPSGKKINVTVTIPVSSFVLPVWSIALSAAQGQTIINLGDISTLLAGTNVFSQLPPGLSEVGNFGLKAIQVNFTQTGGSFSVSGIAVNVGCSDWPVGPKGSPVFIIKSAGFTLSIQNPFDSVNRRISTVIYGIFELDPKNPTTNLLTITMTIPPGNADWVLNAAGEFNLDNVSVFNNLPGGFDSGNINLPAEVSGAKLVINYFTISFSPSSLQLSFIKFSILLNATWWIIDNEFGIANPMLQVYIPGASLPSPPPLSVAASGEILLPDNVILDVAASYASGGAWSFAAALAPGSQVNLITLVQKLIGSDINPDSSLNLDKLLITAFAMSVVSDPSIPQTTYALSGTTVAAWSATFGALPSIEATADLSLVYDGKGTSGSVAVTLDIFGIEFTVKYNFTPNNYTLELDWKGFVFTYDSKSDSITATGGDWSVGQILTALINEIDPTLDFSLPDPWSLLNSISLKGLSLTIDLKTKNISFTYTLSKPIELFFITINGFSVSVENSSSVVVSIDGSYLGGTPIPKWDAVNDSPPSVPGSGKDLFNLKFLALGQHVSLTGLDAATTVQKALEDYEQYLKPPDQGSTTVPVSKTPGTPPVGTLVFDAGSSWLLAADFTVAQFYQLQFVFNDPNLYGLRIGIAEGATYFKNLDFEILYKKISDTIGMYQLDLQLPDVFRHLEFGEVSITLPNISIQVYTNGNFYIDFGFPASITDFSRSFAIQVFPFVGYGGFYFGLLSGATSTQVPTTTFGQFNPVIEAGLGLSLGVGKTIDEGIFTAGLSLTVVGIFEGVLGYYTCYADSKQTATYYRFQATVGIIGHIYGSVNFAIISAQFDILAYIYATIVVESHKPIPISFKAGVTIKLTVKINLGLFKISISLSFSATISASFTIGSDTSSSALWNNPCTSGIAARQLAFADAAAQYKLVWQPLVYDSGLATPPAIKLVFIPHLTIDTAAGNTQAAQYVAMLYIDTPATTDTVDSSSLGSLAQGVLAWAINAIVNSGTTGTTYSQLLTQQVTADQLTALMCVFTQQQNNQSPFNYINPTTSGNDVRGFLQAYFTDGQKSTINIVPVPAGTDTTMNASVFPPLPDLQLLSTVNGNTIASADFSSQSMTGTQNYISDVTAVLSLLNVNYQSNTAASQAANPICNSVDNSGVAIQTDLSLPTFFFTDFISLLAKQMIQNASDYLGGQGLTTITIAELFTKVCTVGNTISLSGMASRFLLHGLRLPTPPVAASGAIEPLYVLTGQQFAIPAQLKTTDSFIVSLQKAATTNWINFSGDTAATALPVTVSSTEITRITQTAGVTITPAIEAGYPMAAPLFYDGQQAFTLGSPALWQYPGSYYTGLTNQPYILKLPSNLQNDLAAYSGATPAFTVQYIDRSAANPQPVDVQQYTWATAVNITVQKITADGTAQSPLQGNMYNLTGADDTGVFFLESLVAYLNSNAGFTGQVQLLYQPDPAANSNGGYVSTLNNTTIPPAAPDQVAIAIVQANLSTETNPEQSLMAFAEVADTPTPSNTLNSFADFVTLLWECSIVRSGGFYLYYNNVAGGNTGLPDALFDGNSSAKIQLLITYNSFVPGAFLNSMVIGDSINYANASLFAQSPAFSLRSAMMPQGNIGYLMQRAVPAEYVPPTDPNIPPSTAQDELYLEHQFNLVGVTLPINPLYQNLLPSGPVDGDNTGAEVKTADDGIWNYSGIVPFNRFVPNVNIMWDMADPYAGIGTTASLLLNWQDMFGNTLPLATGKSQINIPVGYTDTIVAVSQWPSTSVYYEFSGDGTTNPQFQLSFIFDTSKYTTGDQSAINNAAVDLLTWARLWFQLNHGADMQMSYTVSINATAALPMGTVQTIDMGQLQTAFVTPIVNYLYAIATGATIPQVNTSYPLSLSINPATVADYQYIFALTTVITMQRINNIDPAFAGVPGVAFANTPVQPYVQQSISNAASSLLYFTQLFETAFNNPASTVVYKVSTSTNLSTSSSDPVKAPPIWIVRFDTAGKNGIGVTYQQDDSNNTIAYYFAPVPLATSLQSFAATIVPYATGVPFNPSAAGTNSNFSSIDLDNWGLQLLEAVDKFLSPDYAVPAFLLDNGTSLQQVLDTKQLIAEAITGTVDYIINLPKGSTSLADMGNAQEKWYQQLLIQLAAAYEYTAAVQTPVMVQSCWSGPNTDPPVQGSSPRLYGKIMGNVANNGGAVSAEQNASFSAAKLPIAAGASWLTYMFQVENGQSQSITFSPLQFAVSHVEWQYEAVEGIDGYLSTSWLLIVNPQTLPAGYTNTGEVQIPIPLKAYPAPPSVTGQASNYPSVNPPASINPVVAARSWDYTYTYQAPAVPQDTTIMQVQLNVNPGAKASSNALTAVPLTLDQALGQFMSMYPQVSSDFDSFLLNVKSATDPNAKNAANAVNAFISILNIIGTAWNNWNQVNPYKPSDKKQLYGKKLAAPVPAQVTLLYTVEETSAGENPQNPLIINVTPDAGNALTGIPVIDITGFTRATAVNEGTTSYTYTNTATGDPLLYIDRDGVPVRNTAIETLDVFEMQNASAGLQLKRNLDLLLQRGSTTQWQTTNPLFVYQTPMVMFYTIYQPLFSSGSGIDIALIPSAGGTPPPLQRSMADQMAAWANALTASITDLESLTVKLECLYEYQVNNTGLSLSMPVLLLPPYPLTVADEGAAFAKVVGDNITTWFKQHNPITNQGQWLFNLQVYSSFGTNLPVLSRQFFLALTSLTG